MELFTSAGMDFVKELKFQGKRVFPRPEINCDIGETVKRAVPQVAKVGVDLLTVHAQRQVVLAAAGRAESRLKILAVSVLTSFDDADLNSPMAMRKTSANWLNCERATPSRRCGRNRVLGAGSGAGASPPDPAGFW